MKNIVIIFIFSALLFTCKEKAEPAPTATGKYEGTWSGYVSPMAVQGTCSADLVEADSKVTGTMTFKNFYSGDFIYNFNGTINGNQIQGTFPVSSVGTFPYTGTISSDRKTIEGSLNPDGNFNLKWKLTKK